MRRKKRPLTDLTQQSLFVVRERHKCIYLNIKTDNDSEVVCVLALAGSETFECPSTFCTYLLCFPFFPHIVSTESFVLICATYMQRWVTSGKFSSRSSYQRWGFFLTRFQCSVPAQCAHLLVIWGIAQSGDKQKRQTWTSSFFLFHLEKVLTSLFSDPVLRKLFWKRAVHLFWPGAMITTLKAPAESSSWFSRFALWIRF